MQRDRKLMVFGGATGSFVSILGIKLKVEKQKETEKIDTEL